MFISIREAINVIRVAVSTIRRWEMEGKFHPDFRTCGGHRRYSLSRIKSDLFKDDSSNQIPDTKKLTPMQG